MDHNNEKDMDADMDERVEVENQNKLQLGNLNLKRAKNEHHKKQSQVGEDADAAAEASDIDQKARIINANAQKRRVILIFTSLGIIILLSIYFVIAYFLAMNTFQTASTLLPDLQTVFLQGTCLDSTINYLREDEIHNDTLTLLGIPTSDQKLSATSYFIDYC